MPVVVSCSACGRKLKVRDPAMGRKVPCPGCGEAFWARTDGDAAEESRDRGSSESGDDTYAIQSEVSADSPPSRRPDEELPRRRRRPAYGPDDIDEDLRGGRPHRAPLILTLGILSIVLACIPLFGWILGAVSMTLGSGTNASWMNG